MKMSVFYDVAPFSLLEIYRRFRGILCLHNIVTDLMMEAISAEKHQSVSPYYMAQHPRRHRLHANHLENLKSHNMFCVHVLSTSYVQRLVLIKARYYLDRVFISALNDLSLKRIFLLMTREAPVWDVNKTWTGARNSPILLNKGKYVL
jgi:hypothetical protein